MSIFGSIAHAIGHTAESLASEIGEGIDELESLVGNLDLDGIDILSNAARLGLSPARFLRSMLDLIRGDPHQMLLNHLVGPFQPVHEPVQAITTQWAQFTALHQDTAQQIDTHISVLFQDSGTHAYGGPAADTLWDTHQGYQKYFVTMTDHAQTQQTRYGKLGGSFGDFLSQAPGKVNSLSTPMAALGALSFETLDLAPTPVVTTPILEEGAVEAIVAAMEADLAAGVAGPEIWPIIGIILVILVIILIIVILIYLIKDALEDHQKDQHGTTVPTPTPGPSPTPPHPGLTPEQQRLLNDVKQRLQGSTYNDWEIEQLILAGYTDPATIASIIKRGSTFFMLFNDPKTAALMNELTPAQQQKFLDMVAQYQSAHPGLTTHQVYNALSYIKMKGQYNLLASDLTTDPVSQAFPRQTQEFLDRLKQKVGNSLNNVTDPFAVTDQQLTGWYAILTGTWGEWASIKQYHQQGKLVDFSVPIPNGEIDIKIRENGVEKWIELKNVVTPGNQWGKAISQARKYAQNGATHVIIQLPQQGVNGNPNLSQQQLNNLEQLKRQFPSVDFEVRTGASDPGILIPFDPPATNWGSQIP
jgi:hypothetical protein